MALSVFYLYRSKSGNSTGKNVFNSPKTVMKRPNPGKGNVNITHYDTWLRGEWVVAIQLQFS